MILVSGLQPGGPVIGVFGVEKVVDVVEEVGGGVTGQVPSVLVVEPLASSVVVCGLQAVKAVPATTIARRTQIP
jgi:hypothetical protein